MKQFIYKTAIIAFPIILILVSINYFGDAARLFNSEYEKKMAEIINSGTFVTNISDYDERILQKELIFSMKESPEVIVIGSSRTMLINAGCFPEKKFFNNSVSGASIEDIIAIYQMYKERNYKPQKIILSVDPWMFNQNRQGYRWKSIEYYYNLFYAHEVESKIINYNSLYKYKQLFSFSYFQISIKRIDDRIRSNTDPVASDDKYNVTNTKLQDGSLTYGETYRNASQNEIDLKIKKYVQGEIYGLKSFHKISSEKMNEFKIFIEQIQNNGIELELFISPYAPKSYEVIVERHPAVKNLEKMIKIFADTEYIKVYGSFNPKTFGFDETYFYDGMHCREKAISYLIESGK